MALNGGIDVNALVKWKATGVDARSDSAAAVSASSSAATSGNDNKPSAATPSSLDEKYTRWNQVVYHSLMLALNDDEVLMTGAQVTDGDGAGMWKALVTRYESQTRASKAHMRKMLHTTRMKADEPFDMYRARLLHCVHRLRDMGESVSDGELVFRLLEGLPGSESYEMVQKTLELQDDLTFDAACNKIREHQEKEKLRGSRVDVEHLSTDVAAYAFTNRGGNSRNTNTGGVSSDRDRPHPCGLCRGGDHREWDCSRRRGRGNACFVCGKDGHRWRNCMVRRKDHDHGHEEAGLLAWEPKPNPDYVCDVCM
jgi:hypothetical protein